MQFFFSSHLVNKTKHMQAGMSIYIPQPCHEDWDKMDITAKGKFCNACAKQVIDFTNMSDRQLIEFFENYKGGACGRFAGDQLQRQLTTPVKEKKKKWWLAAMMPLLFMFDKAGAQTSKPPVNIEDTTRGKEPQEMLVGKVAFVREPTVLVKGKVQDASGTAIPLAAITTNKVLAGSGDSEPVDYFADSLGNFSIEIPLAKTSATLIVSAEGYKTQDIDINLPPSDVITITLDKQEEMLVGEIAAQPLMGDTVVIVAGGICVSPKVTIADTLSTLIHKLTNTEAFRVFPNPVLKRSDVFIDLKSEGKLTIQLLDNNSRLLLVKQVDTDEEKGLIALSLPPFIAPGMYYVRVVDEKNRKQHTEKLIVQ